MKNSKYFNFELTRHFTLNRLKDLVFSRDYKRNRYSYPVFPLNIGKLTYTKRIKINKSVNMYYFAEYKNPKGEYGFAKAWFGNRKDSTYYWLKNEITVFSAANKILKGNSVNKICRYHIPKVLNVFEDEHALILISKKIENAEVVIPKRISNDVYNQCFEFLHLLSPKLVNIISKDVLHIGPKKILLSTPLFILIVLLKKRELRWEALKAIYLFIHSGHKLFIQNWNSLVHRDLKGEIIASGNRYFIVDWQTAAISNNLLEAAQLLLSYWKDGKPTIDLFEVTYFKEILRSENRLECFKLLCVYVALVEIVLVKEKTLKDEKSFLHAVLNFKKEK